MDRKHGKYEVNTEHSEHQPPIMCSDDQEAHSSACWHPPSSAIAGNVSSSFTGVCVRPAVLEYSGCSHTEQSPTQVKGNCCRNWSLWSIFFACLLACVITTAIGVLIICLVNNRGNDSSSIVINLPSNDGDPQVVIHGKTTAASQPTVTTKSTEPTTTATSTDPATTSTSTEPSTTTITSTEPSTTTAASSTSSQTPYSISSK